MTANNENQEEKKVAQPVAAAPVDLATFDWDAYENDEVVPASEKEELTKKYEDTLSSIAEKEVVEGTGEPICGHDDLRVESA